MKETHNSMDHLLSAINYQEHKCGDLKAVELVIWFQNGCTKYPCFLCLGDSQADDQHYVRQEWPLRQGLRPRLHNIQFHFLVEPNKILVPSLHIKLGVMKNFMKAMDRKGCVFIFLQEKFSRISMEKLKSGIFNGLQIRELMKDPMFDEALEGNWRASEEFPLTRGVNVSQTALSAVTLGLFSKEQLRFE